MLTGRPVDATTDPELPPETSVVEEEVELASLLVDDVVGPPPLVVVVVGNGEVVLDDVGSPEVSDGPGAQFPARDVGACTPYLKPDGHDSSGNAQ